MSVYVDDMRTKFGRMIMCHMIADNHGQLIAMAARIGVNLKWIQHPGTAGEHFDIALSKRAEAVRLGAVEITWRQCAAMTKRREVEGELGTPEAAEEWLRQEHRKKSAAMAARQAAAANEEDFD